MIALVGSPGPLTDAVEAALRAEGRATLRCALDARTALDRTAPLTFRIEHLGTLLDRLRAWGVAAVCLAGAVRRPLLDPGQVDDLTAPLLPGLRAALGQGDDGALRWAMGAFEAAGLAVLAAHDLAPHLLPEPGVLSRARPTQAIEEGADRAAALHRLLAPADLGQALVVRGGEVLAVEASPGTDHMLRTIEGIAGGGLLFKAPKAGQDRRADLPVIGPETIRGAVGAGLAAVVIEAGGVMVLGRDEAVALADAAGLVLWVRL
jgi:DUF1009 family protein